MEEATSAPLPERPPVDEELTTPDVPLVDSRYDFDQPLAQAAGYNASHDEGVLKIIPRSSKNCLRPRREVKQHFINIPAAVGILVDVRCADEIMLGPDGAVLAASERYKHRPRYYECISELGAVVSRRMGWLQKPPDGQVAHKVARIICRDSDRSVAAAETLSVMLENSRNEVAPGQRSQLEKALCACGFFRTHTYTDLEGESFRRLVGALPNADEIVELCRTARSHYMSAAGNLLLSQDANPDGLIVEHASDDIYAARVSRAFIEVMRSRRALDTDSMSQMKFLLLPADIADGLTMGYQEQEQYIRDGNEVVAAFIDLLMQNGVGLSLYELKVSTGLGESRDTDKMWAKHHHDLDTVVRNARFQTGKGYAQTHKKVRSWELDAIKTLGVLGNVFRNAQMAVYKDADARGYDIGEFRPANAPELSDVMGRVGLSVCAARVNVREGRKLSSDDWPARNIRYAFSHPLRTIRVPYEEDVQVALMPIHDLTVRGRTPEWQSELHQAAMLGKFLVRDQSKGRQPLY